jgi:hypothetical protein
MKLVRFSLAFSKALDAAGGSPILANVLPQMANYQLPISNFQLPFSNCTKPISAAYKLSPLPLPRHAHQRK